MRCMAILALIARGDVVLALSASGETEEILQLVPPAFKRLRIPLVALTFADAMNV